VQYLVCFSSIKFAAIVSISGFGPGIKEHVQEITSRVLEYCSCMEEKTTWFLGKELAAF
jgi:hypothetical protein